MELVFDEAKLEERGYLGAPNMVVEIISIASAKYDFNDKYNLYEAAGVREYRVASPKDKAVVVFILKDNGKFDKGTIYEKEMVIPVKTLPGLKVSIENIFPFQS